MASADHSQFQFAAERYALGELSEEEKLAFEEHYFSCGACAQDVEDLTSIRMAAPAVLPRLDKAGATKTPFRWFANHWIPQVAFGALALLVLVAGYQNAVEIPRLKAASEDSLRVMAAPEPLVTMRGGGVQTIKGLPRTAPLLIANEWPVSYPKYRARVTRHNQGFILDEAETQEAKGSLWVSIPARKLGPGDFDLTISGEPLGGKVQDVARYPFTIQGD